MLAESGLWYSNLLEHPYLDPIKFHVIDPMHTLLLGTAKHMMLTWTQCGILTTKVLNDIEKGVKPIQVPKDVDQLHLMISYSIAGFLLTSGEIGL